MTTPTIARHLIRTFVALVAVIAVTGAVAGLTTWHHHRLFRQITEGVLPERLANTQLRVVVSDAQRGLRGYLLTGDSQFADVYTSAVHDYPAAADALRRLVAPAERPAVTQELDRADVWLAFAARQRTAPPRSDLAVSYAQQGRPLFDLFLAANVDVDRRIAARADALIAQARIAQETGVATIAVITILGLLAGVLTAVRASRRINRPLRGLLATLSRLRAGDVSARAAVAGPAEIRALAETLNRLSEENEQAGRAARTRARLRDVARKAGLRVRENLSVDAALHAAADTLGERLDADVVVVRLAGMDRPDRRAAWWSEGTPRADCLLAGQPVDWLHDRYLRGELWCVADVAGTDPAADPGDVPGAERAALLAAGAVSVLTVPFGTGSAVEGAITLVRRRPGRPWQPAEVEAAEWVAADVSRGVQQAGLYEQEQRLVAELRELNRAKTDFLSTVSHELRTPLTSITGYVELMRDSEPGPLTQQQNRMLGIIERNAARLRNLIENLLTVSRVEAGTFRTVRQPTDLAGLVDAAARSVQPDADGALTFTVECPDRPLVASVDPYQIDRVLTNLLTNAVKFSPGGGRITLRMVQEGPVVVLSVSDTGMGIPDADQREVFTRFYRASNAIIKSIPGTGLGLAIVRTIVTNHGGEVSVRSRLGEGTTVTIRLPREAEPADGVAAAPSLRPTGSVRP